jgi:biopolymer transport protein ExbD/biopolymer transport protein TolR
MAMTVGGGGGDRRLVTPNMNVTPLVDVVLVLLIIFIVITPQLNRKLWVHTPKQEKQELEELRQDPNPPLVMRIGEDRQINVNGVVLAFEDVPQRLRRMFAARDDHVLFFDAADGVDYGFVVSAMDQARAGGAVTIAPLGDKLGGASDSASATEPAAPVPAQ